MRGVRRGLWLLAAGAMGGTGASVAAQTPNHPAGAVVQPLPGADAGAELRRHLSDLAANPRSLASLVGAGRAAVQVGDGQAALGFFARAEEIAPRDARVKAGMASAFVLLEQPQAALRFFMEASQLGAPEVEIARDRGLAYDMLGNPRRAQQDYTLVLQRGDDAEVRRRMALSLAISGNREAALRTLEPLLRRHDRAASRTRAFVLALTGDANGAAQAVQAAMPGQGSAMAPFLARLSALNPAQKAMAVHFGRFPADGRPVQMAQAVDTSAHPAAVALTNGGRPPAAQSAPARQGQQRTRGPNQLTVRRRDRDLAPVARAPRRRPGTEEFDTAERVGPGSRTPVRRSYTPPATQPARTATAAARPAQVARNDSRVPSAAQQRVPARTEPAVRPTPPPEQVQPQQAPEVAAPASKPETNAAEVQPGFTAPLASSTAPAVPEQQPARADILPTQLPPSINDDRVVATQPETAAAPDLDDIAALVRSLPVETEAPPVAQPRSAASRPAVQPTRTASVTPRPARSQPTAAAYPSRHWVQLAGGERGAFPYQLGRLRQRVPQLLQGRIFYWAVNGSSNRLLVGPFATAAEARAFVNQLARQQVSSFPWTSRAGEEVARLPAR